MSAVASRLPPTRTPDLSLPFMLTAARKIYPSRKLGTLKNWYALLSAATKARPVLREMLARGEHQALLAELQAHPETLGFVEWPYIHASWSVAQRFEALSQHMQALQGEMAALDMARNGSVLIADMNEVYPGLRLTVDRAFWCLREGSLVFNQFIGDDRMMTLCFSFGMEGGERVVYVGAVQGSNSEAALATYKEVAKGLQGMRSRDFLVKAFQLLMHHLGVQRILCIAEEERHHRHPYFTTNPNEKFNLDYNEIWAEHNGEPAGGGFWQLPLQPAQRPMEEIAAKNRALYRRRYALMDKLSADIGARFGKSAA
ncbi:MAG TPA: DUF535 family protein [Rhizobacter sp.]|nr:DUF535 family protein [Rhizobacter sp.]